MAFLRLVHISCHTCLNPVHRAKFVCLIQAFLSLALPILSLPHSAPPAHFSLSNRPSGRRFYFPPGAVLPLGWGGYTDTHANPTWAGVTSPRQVAQGPGAPAASAGAKEACVEPQPRSPGRQGQTGEWRMLIHIFSGKECTGVHITQT